MPKKIDLTGKTFGRWTVISEGGRNLGAVQWNCRCLCGTEAVVLGNSLRHGFSSSCGCLQREMASKRHRIHGMSRTSLGSIFNCMQQRCYNPTNENYSNYGQRGIQICEEWKSNSSSFYTWAKANGWRIGLTIERKNVNGNYTPDNCTWATLKEQSRNQRRTIFLPFRGKMVCLSEVAEVIGMNPGTLYHRIKKYNWAPEIAIKTPAIRGNRYNKLIVTP